MPQIVDRLLSRFTWVVLALAVLLPLSPLGAAADTGRVALIIGNGAYGADIGSLRNPTNDAKLMASTLKKLGFKVTLALDVDQKEMKRRIRDFGADLSAIGPQGIGLFYYAGHGLQVDGENFLLPIGAEIQREGDVSVEAVSANTVLAQMQYGNVSGVNLVFLDACRNNPLSRGFRSATRGLARVDAPRGSFVGYSTAPGEVSVDGNGENSPYTLALAKELQRPGEAIEEVHRAVRLQVLAATNDQQTPWDSSSLTASVVLAGQPSVAAAAAPAPSPAPTPAPVASSAKSDPQEAERAWNEVKNNNNPNVLRAFLQQYPTGLYAALAQDRLDQLTGGAQQVASAAPAPAETVTRASNTQPTEPVQVAAAPAPAMEPMNEPYIAIKSANIRAEPNTKAKVLGKLQSTESVTVIGRTSDGEWLQIATGAGTGYVSAKLLKPDPNVVAMVAPAPEPAPEPVAVAPKVNALRISSALKEDIEKYLRNSADQSSSFRFLAVSADGERMGMSTNCKKKSVGWGGWSSEGCNEEGKAKKMALDVCGSDCRIIFEGANKVGDFEIEWY